MRDLDNHDEEDENMPSSKKHRTDDIDNNHGENEEETVGAESFGLDAGVQSPLPTSSAPPTFIEE
jgi:hypothetical protein